MVIGTPEPFLNIGWKEELDAVLQALRQVRERFEDVLTIGAVSIAATSRCAVALATLPIIAKYNPSACVVWFDSHGDLNTRRSHQLAIWVDWPLPALQASGIQA
ncbi:hypothetical protein WH356_23335 [Ochrobactrum sp. MYb379]|uniref:hypothetical protein n=1 Tax=Ochrobactrum sp. EDr1-4 TaxID=3368622 RepID=UPI0030A6AFC5